MSPSSPFDNDALPRTAANYAPLTPLTFIRRAADVHGDRCALVYRGQSWTWRQTLRRCRRLASALRRRGIGKNDTVSVLAPNIPAVYEVHFGVPMAGAVLNAINTRLDARTVAHILTHGGARLVMADRSLSPLLRDALLLVPGLLRESRARGEGSRMTELPQVVIIEDAEMEASDQSDPGGSAADVAALGASIGTSFLTGSPRSPGGTGGGRRGGGGVVTYEELLLEGDERYEWEGEGGGEGGQGGRGGVPSDEWDSMALNYTSGTTAKPKGVVCTHRGAYLSALANVLAWGLHALPGGQRPVYLWTLPLFHCNGWTFPWVLAAVAGTNVCCREVTSASILSLIPRHNVTHMCAAPVVLNFLIHAPDSIRLPFLQAQRTQALSSTSGSTGGSSGGDSNEGSSSRVEGRRVSVMTAGAAPPPAVLGAIEAMGFEVLHTYGLTETYGPSVVCEWQHERWRDVDDGERARLKARQGVRYVALEGLAVMDPVTMRHVAADGRSVGEVMMRGNMVMKGYAGNLGATDAAFQGGWFHSGDLAVMHPDGYIEIKDRSKDIIISGGENVSSIAVEAVLYRHPAVLEAAVVARPDTTWGESVCAFVCRKPGEKHARVGEGDIIAFCRDHLPHYMAPRTVVFSELPKTATGKIQKFVLRERAKEMGSLGGGARPKSRM
ncbi:hypothetical protein CLOM_g11592 [Closterium sp. NIES-68]|nr:hypothetical protein CLOM_g11592 [Closterium sp. NIES-68]GJP70507.1 hypothetical protein CLOP_g1441 [Closterium sp. NIES-67]